MNENESEDFISHLVEEISTRLRVAVEWDGYYDPTCLDSCWDIAVSTESYFTFKNVKTSIFNDKVVTQESLQMIADSCRKLEALLVEDCWKILEYARKENQDVKKIPAKYFDYAVKKMEHKYKAQCVLIAPDRWLPHLND